jgi:hypothetical protein
MVTYKCTGCEHYCIVTNFSLFVPKYCLYRSGKGLSNWQYINKEAKC